MSFVEGISAASIDITDPAVVVCVGGIMFLLGLLAATPALATVLKLLHPERAIERLSQLMGALGLRRRKH